MFEKRYIEQVRILLNTIPLINRYKEFAIKGGTAINFFIFDVPRLSVDIDLCYLPIQLREQTFVSINRIMLSLEEDIKKRFPGYSIKKSKSMVANVFKLIVTNRRAALKIEPNELLRGSVKKAIRINISREIEKIFNLYPEGQILDVPDLFGGKICAALDRQHPRDLFDINMMFRNNLFSDEVRKVFLLYLIQSNRPMVELLDSKPIDIGNVYKNEFKGMVKEDISLERLMEARELLIVGIRRGLTDAEKGFLLSLKAGKPDWEKLGIGNFAHLPGVKWKLLNIDKMKKAKRIEAYKKLEKILY